MVFYSFCTFHVFELSSVKVWVPSQGYLFAQWLSQELAYVSISIKRLWLDNQNDRKYSVRERKTVASWWLPSFFYSLPFFSPWWMFTAICEIPRRWSYYYYRHHRCSVEFILFIRLRAFFIFGQQNTFSDSSLPSPFILLRKFH